MLRLTPLKSNPWLPDGNIDTSNSYLAGWWEHGSRLGSTAFAYEDGYMVATRGGAVFADGSETSGPSFMYLLAGADPLTLSEYDIINYDVPAFTPEEHPFPYNTSEFGMTALAACQDPSVVTDGHNRIFMSYKMRQHGDNFTPTAFTGLGIGQTAYVTLTDGGVPPSYEKVLVKEWDDDGNKIKNLTHAGYDSNGEWVDDPDYEVTNIGESWTLDILFLKDGYEGANLTAEYDNDALKAWAYSDDRAQTFTFGGLFVDANDRPSTWGQCTFWYERGLNGHDWHMIRTGVARADQPDVGDLLGSYYYSDGPNFGTGDWQWFMGAAFGEEKGGNKGNWDNESRIGIDAHFGDEDYVYITPGGGSGMDRVNADVDVLEDWTDPSQLDSAYDYPQGLGLWRVKVADMLDSSKYEEYPRNPIYWRGGSVGFSNSASIWNSSSLTGPDGNLWFTSEQVGPTFPTEISDAQRLNIMDTQYGKRHAFLRLDHNSAYEADEGFSALIRVSPDHWGCDLVTKGRFLRDIPSIPPNGGTFYLGVSLEGALTLKYFYDSPSGNQVERNITSADGLVQTGVYQNISVSLTPEGTAIYYETDTPVASGPPASFITEDRLFFGDNGAYVRPLKGFYTQIILATGGHTLTEMQNLTDEDGRVGMFWLGDVNIPEDGNATSPDSSATGNDIELRGPVKLGSLYGDDTDSIYLPGEGIFYDGAAGSQQHWSTLKGGTFTEWWDKGTYADGATLHIRDARSGKYLALEGGTVTTSDTPMVWYLRWTCGFIRLNADGGQVEDVSLALETSARVGPTTLSMQTVKGESYYDSPYNRFDQQHWHLVPQPGGLTTIQSRADGRALWRDGTGTIGMADLTCTPDQGWRISEVAIAT